MADDTDEITVIKDGKKYITVKPKEGEPICENRFVSDAVGVLFYDPGPITEEEKREAARLWNQMAQPGTSPGKRKKSV